MTYVEDLFQIGDRLDVVDGFAIREDDGPFVVVDVVDGVPVCRPAPREAEPCDGCGLPVPGDDLCWSDAVGGAVGGCCYVDGEEG